MLPEKAARIDSHGDPALAEVLRDSGYKVAESPAAAQAGNGGVDAVLYDTTGVPGIPSSLTRWPSSRRGAWSRSPWRAVA